jgi:16S rRNA (guanine(966)-N(2))-methyltransferase RsmD
MRGLKLEAPTGDRVRPTLDRVRESLFNILAPDLEGASFLDLYAGSGANGIEALSRGALRAVFIDNHPQSAQCIRKNLATTRCEDRGTCMSYRLPEDLKRIPGTFSIIFADPPFNYGDYAGLIEAIAHANLLAPGGKLIVEHGFKSDLPEVAGHLTRTQARRYGKTELTFYS